MICSRLDTVACYSKAYAEAIDFNLYEKPDIPIKSRFFLTDRDLMEDWVMARCIELGIAYEGLVECYG